MKTLSFYPRVLLSDEYLKEVYNTIPDNVRGIKRWFAPLIQNHVDRKAFEKALDDCWIISLGIPYDGTALLNALRQQRADAKYCQFAATDHRFSLFDVDTWTCEPTKYYIEAVDMTLEVVQGIISKYLTIA